MSVFASLADTFLVEQSSSACWCKLFRFSPGLLWLTTRSRLKLFVPVAQMLVCLVNLHCSQYIMSLSLSYRSHLKALSQFLSNATLCLLSLFWLDCRTSLVSSGIVVGSVDGISVSVSLWTPPSEIWNYREEYNLACEIRIRKHLNPMWVVQIGVYVLSTQLLPNFSARIFSEILSEIIVEESKQYSVVK